MMRIMVRIKLVYLLCVCFSYNSCYATSKTHWKKDTTKKLTVTRSGPRTRASLSLFLWLTDFSSTFLQIKPMAESIQTVSVASSL